TGSVVTTSVGAVSDVEAESVAGSEAGSDVVSLGVGALSPSGSEAGSDVVSLGVGALSPAGSEAGSDISEDGSGDSGTSASSETAASFVSANTQTGVPNVRIEHINSVTILYRAFLFIILILLFSRLLRYLNL
ncbi:MAG: hypothetical protein IKE35_06010, partial [Lachnospiraceae bacterium]|nr:hypothetical protein [Lachnospiraceae bacterium]